MCQICSVKLLILTKKLGLYCNIVVSVGILQRAIRNPSRARQLFPVLLGPSRSAFLNSFAIKARTGPYGSYNKGLYLIPCDSAFHTVDDIVMPTITGSQTIYS